MNVVGAERGKLHASRSRVVSISLLIGGNSGARFLSQSLQTQNLMHVHTNAKRGKTHTPSLTRKKCVRAHYFRRLVFFICFEMILTITYVWNTFILFTFKFPSAVILSLLQLPQKCSLIEVINPIWPTKPGILYA